MSFYNREDWSDRVCYRNAIWLVWTVCPISPYVLRIETSSSYDDVIKWKHFPRYWPFVRGIHRSPVNSLHKGQWRGALIFSLIYAWTSGWVDNRDAGDWRCHGAHYDITVMTCTVFHCQQTPPEIHEAENQMWTLLMISSSSRGIFIYPNFRT